MMNPRTHTLVAEGLDLVALDLTRKKEVARWTCGSVDEPRKRISVLEHALRWLGTPYHDRAMKLGAGVDCARLLAAVYPAAGIIPPPNLPNHSRQWFLSRGEPIFADIVLQHARPVAAPIPGDIAMWRRGRHLAHGAIVADPGWPEIVHAFFDAGIVQRDVAPIVGPKLGPPVFFSHWAPK